MVVSGIATLSFAGVGRLVGSSVKLIPGIGTVLGIVIQSTVGGSLTAILGICIFIAFQQLWLEHKGDMENVSAEVLRNAINKATAEKSYNKLISEITSASLPKAVANVVMKNSEEIKLSEQQKADIVVEVMRKGKQAGVEKYIKIWEDIQTQATPSKSQQKQPIHPNQDGVCVLL